MSWDIYGQPLRAGCCEVHPDVQQPYPCPLCVAETAEYRANRDARKDAMREMEREHYAEGDDPVAVLAREDVERVLRELYHEEDHPTVDLVYVEAWQDALDVVALALGLDIDNDGREDG